MVNQVGEYIRKLRLSLNVSQEELAQFIEINRVTLSNIESGERKLKTDEVQKIADFFEISPSLLIWIKKTRDEKDPHRKIKDLILYIANKLKDRESFWKTVLNKLLYFSDFNYYEWTGTFITGAVYKKLPYWPVPQNITEILNEMVEDWEIAVWDTTFHGFTQQRIIPLKQANIEVFSQIDSQSKTPKPHYTPYDDLPSVIKIVDDVLDKYQYWKAAQISEFSHQDTPYKATKKIWETINPQLVFYRSPWFIVNHHNLEENEDN